MAVLLQNSLFVHVPKTGSRWIWHQLLGHVDGAEYVGKSDAEAHWCPLTDLPVMMGVRHPATWLPSYFAHRNRHGWKPRPGWIVEGELAPLDEMFQSRIKAKDFFLTIANSPGIVTRHLQFWYDRYEDTRIIRMESMAEDLIKHMEDLGESFYEGSIRAAANVKIGKAEYKAQLTGEFTDRLWENEKAFFGQFYNGATP